jgi:hypothetical protein
MGGRQRQQLVFEPCDNLLVDDRNRDGLFLAFLERKGFGRCLEAAGRDLEFLLAGLDLDRLFIRAGDG